MSRITAATDVWPDLALLVPAASGIWAMPEPGLARTRLRLRPQVPNGPASIRATFVRAALAGFAGFAVLGLFTAVAPDFPCEELGEASRAVVGLVVFAVFAAPMAGQVALKLVLEGSPCPPDAWR
jgi:hypothetical protein